MGIAYALSKLLSVTNYTDPRMAFLQDYEYELGADDLVAFGARECVPHFNPCIKKGVLSKLGLSMLERCIMIAIPI